MPARAESLLRELSSDLVHGNRGWGWGGLNRKKSHEEGQNNDDNSAELHSESLIWFLLMDF